MLKWDVTLPSGSNVVLDQQSVLELFEVESGAILSVDQDGNFFSGRGSLTTRRTFVNHGFITGLTGSSQGLFHNDGTIFIDNGFSAVGSTGSTENGDFEQKFFNTGEIRVNSGPLTISGNATNHGTIAIQGGSFSNAAKFRNAGLFEIRSGAVVVDVGFDNENQIDWYGGTLSGLSNFGNLRITGNGQKRTSGLINGEGGMVVHEGDGTLQNTNGGGVIDNRGVWEVTGEASLTGPVSGSPSAFRNFATGTLRKSGTGTATFTGRNELVNQGGTVEVTGGALRLDGTNNATEQGGRFNFANGGRLEVAASNLFVKGTQTGQGNGSLVVIEGGGIAGTADTPQLDFTGVVKSSLTPAPCQQ